MFSTFPIRMNFTSENEEVPVDVYEFTIIPRNEPFEHKAVALCWFVQSKEWKVVDVRTLHPDISNKKSLNE